jgi:hypothetical protein
MHGTKHSLRELFVNDFAKFRSFNIVWDKIIRSKFPKVHANLKRLGIEHMTYTSKWFLTAFLTLPFAPEFRLRIFDRYAAFGMRALLSLGIVMIGKMKMALESRHSRDLRSLLLNPLTHSKLLDCRNLLVKWDKVMMSEARYKKLMKRTGLHSGDGA